MENTNEEIIIVPCGGLANRMRALASGFRLAEDSGHTPRVVWQNNWEIGAEYLDLFEPSRISDALMNVGKIKYALRYEVPRRRNLYISGLSQKFEFGITFIDDINMAFYRDNHKAMLSKALSTGKILVRSGLDFYPYDIEDYKSCFRPSAEVKAIADSLSESFTGNTYGLHIRRTDNAMSIEKSPTELFVEKIDGILETADSGMKFYLATDSEEIKDFLRRRYGNIILYSPNKACRGTRDGMLWGFAELIALSRCKRIFGSFYSSYSEAAAAIGGVPLEQLVKPE